MSFYLKKLVRLWHLAVVAGLVLAFPMVNSANEVESPNQEADPLEDLIQEANERWTGDFDGMTERRMIRTRSQDRHI